MILSKLSRNQNIMGGIREVDKKAIEKLDDEITKFGLRRAAKDGRMVDLVEGTAKVASDAEQKAVEGINSYWENVYKFVTDGIKETGVTAVNIPKLDKYAARMTKEVPEVLTTLELELNKATREANNLLKKNYQDISQIPAEEFDKIRNSVPVQNLVEYLNWLTNSSVQIKDGSGLSIAVRQSMRSEDSIRVLDKVARSTIERTATDFGIPNFIREKDIYKIMDRYSQDMLSYLYQREPLAELRSYARMIRARDGLSEAKYIETIVEDTLGVRKGTTAHFMRDAKGQIARLLNPAIEKAKAEGNQTAEFVYSSIKEMADLPSFLANQIYPNLLGWNPKAVLTNVLGSISRAAPELGGTYGYTNLARGLVWARQNWSNASKELVQKGYVPGEWTRTAQKALADGIRASSLVNIPLKTLEKINALGMWFYSKSEQLNRIVLLGMSKTMAYDLSLGRAAAQRSLSKFPTSVRRAVSRAKNITEIEDILMGHMNSKIGLDYNRSSLSEFARTMGPMFSTFSKWPTTIAGETISEYRVKPMSAATRRSAERYAIPLLGFAAIDYMLADHLEESDTLQKIVGKGGLRSAAPVSAATAFVRGDIFTPPVVDTIMQDIIIPVSNAEGVKLGKGLDRTAFTYTPGAGLIKFLTDTIPTFVTGERPEGSTQTERSLKGSGVIY
jgi:hypothetical protein